MMMSPEETEAKRLEEEAKKRAMIRGDKEEEDPLITKSEMRNEMRSMIQELMGLGMIGPKTLPISSELKLELIPNDVKLEGSKNYLSWSRRVRVLLGGKGVEHYLEEGCVEPVDRLSPEWRVWYTTNSIIVAWLLASMSSSVSKMVEAMRTAAQIWKTLSNMYSRKGNVMMMMEIQSKADAVKQTGRPVEQYAGELQYLWGELDHYAPLQMVCPQDAQVVHKWVEDRRVTHFLKNLDPDFESRRAAFCHQESLPTMDEAVSAMINEESRLRVMTANDSVKSAYTATDDRDCYNCGEKGHLSYNCPHPRGSGERGGGTRGATRSTYGRGRGGYGRGRGGRARGRGRGAPRVNVVVTEDTPSITLTGEQAKRWEEWHKEKESECPTSTPLGSVATTSTQHFGNFANYAHSGAGTQAQALASSCRSHRDWIIDSGASRHVTGLIDSFKTYSHSIHPETVQIADGTSQLIHGVGSIECTPSINLSSVLHVPSFPVNLLSVSSIIDQFKCLAIFDEQSCVFQEKRTGKRIGTGVRRNGLWFISQEEQALSATTEGNKREIMLLHRRLGHVPFESLSKLYPESFKGMEKGTLVCDACELAKHTRSTYPSIGLRSSDPFMLIHSDVWGPCSTTFVSGFKWFVTFIDCYSRMTWIYMLKHKNEVLRCFKDFYKLVTNQFNAKIQILRTDNGTEYVNNEFISFISDQGIIHQTTCPGTPS
jgi:hypothetical protein